MHNLNKKGLAEVISLVVFILLALASGFILFDYFRESQTLLSPASSCANLQLQNALSITTACIENNQIKLNLERGNEGDSSSVKFSSFNNGNKISEWDCNQDTCNTCLLMDKGESRNYFLNIPDQNLDEIVLYVQDCLLVRKELVTCQL